MVGTSLGVVVALPVPRLQGIPKVTGKWTQSQWWRVCCPSEQLLILLAYLFVEYSVEMLGFLHLHVLFTLLLFSFPLLVPGELTLQVPIRT